MSNFVCSITNALRSSESSSNRLCAISHFNYFYSFTLLLCIKSESINKILCPQVHFLFTATFFACILKRINHLSKHDCLLYLLEDTELTEKKKVIKRKLRNIFKCQYYTFASTLDLGTDKTIWHSPRQDSGDEFEQSTHYLLQKLENLRDYKRTLYFNFLKF